jgi:hypothetical protein
MISDFVEFALMFKRKIMSLKMSFVFVRSKIQLIINVFRTGLLIRPKFQVNKVLFILTSQD